MDQEKINDLLTLIAEALFDLDCGGYAIHETNNIKMWMEHNAPEFLKN